MGRRPGSTGRELFAVSYVQGAGEKFLAYSSFFLNLPFPVPLPLSPGPRPTCVTPFLSPKMKPSQSSRTGPDPLMEQTSTTDISHPIQ